MWTKYAVFWLIARNPDFRDKKCAILTFCDKNVVFYHFATKSRCSTISWSDDEDDDDDENDDNDDDDDDFAQTCVAKMSTTKATVMATAMATIVPECNLIIIDQTMWKDKSQMRRLLPCYKLNVMLMQTSYWRPSQIWEALI